MERGARHPQSGSKCAVCVVASAVSEKGCHLPVVNGQTHVPENGIYLFQNLEQFVSMNPSSQSPIQHAGEIATHALIFHFALPCAVAVIVMGILAIGLQLILRSIERAFKRMIGGSKERVGKAVRHKKPASGG